MNSNRYSASLTIRRAIDGLLADDAAAPKSARRHYDAAPWFLDDEATLIEVPDRPDAVAVTIADEEATIHVRLVGPGSVTRSDAQLNNATAPVLAALIAGYLA